MKKKKMMMMTRRKKRTWNMVGSCRNKETRNLPSSFFPSLSLQSASLTAAAGSRKTLRRRSCRINRRWSSCRKEKSKQLQKH
jgi:hypothetical protein